MLLNAQAQAPQAQASNPSSHAKSDLSLLYLWGERDYALEQILMHTPARWLPPAYPTWDDFLAAATDRALLEAHAPQDLTTWRYGTVHTLDIEAPVYEQSALLRRLLGPPTGTGPVPQSGDATTIKQVGHTFGPSEPLHRHPRQLAPNHPKPRSRPIRQPRKPLLPRPIPSLAPRHHLPLPLHAT